MPLWDRIKQALGATPTTGAVALDGERLVLRDLERARAFPQEPAQTGRKEMQLCEQCAGPLRQVVFTTAGSGEQLALWRAYPLALDGWLCTRCGWSAVPRYISPEESVEYGRNGNDHAKKGNFDDAEFWFRRILGSWPGYGAAYADLGQVRLARADAATDPQERLRYRQEATELFRRALAASNSGPLHGVRLQLARALALSGNEGDALVELAALENSSVVDEALRNEAGALAESIREGKALFSRATEHLQGLPFEPPAKRLTPAERQQLEQGRALLREALGRKATFPTALVLGKTELRLGNLEAAAQVLETACALEPQQPNGQRELCAAYLELGRTSDALPVAQRAVDLRPEDPTLRCNLAFVLLLNGQLEAARREVGTANAVEPYDKITLSVAKLIEDVAAGRRKQPTTIAEAEGRPRH